MSSEGESLDPRSHPGARGYTFLCLLALLIVVLVLVQRDLGWLALLPLLTGSVAVAACWSIGPPLVILCVAGSLAAHGRSRFVGLLGPTQGSLLGDLILAGALLAYSAGQYRLQALVQTIFPSDPRRRRRRRGPAIRPIPPFEQARSPELVGPLEVTQLVVAVVGSTGLGAVVWVLLASHRPPLGFDPWVWRLLVLAWLGCLVAGVTWVVTGWLQWQRISPEESLVYLQDQLWKDTRREQSRLNRWLAWYRLRRQRRLRRKEMRS
jgi:hypothetical protein